MASGPLGGLALVQDFSVPAATLNTGRICCAALHKQMLGRNVAAIWALRSALAREVARLPTAHEDEFRRCTSR